MHDELSLHNMQSIVKKSIEGKRINKIDPILCQSTYMGNSVFHLCYNKFAILECLHKQVCGTKTPGEVGEIFVSSDDINNNSNNDEIKIA